MKNVSDTAFEDEGKDASIVPIAREADAAGIRYLGYSQDVETEAEFGFSIRGETWDYTVDALHIPSIAGLARHSAAKALAFARKHARRQRRRTAGLASALLRAARSLLAEGPRTWRYKGHRITVEQDEGRGSSRNEYTVVTPSGKTLYPDLDPYELNTAIVERWIDAGKPPRLGRAPLMLDELEEMSR